jgi:two-component system catabolic regulation response regulator CreB
MEKPLILVVEDEPAIADAIVYALESEGLRCHRLGGGAEVIDTLERHAVSLVVLDIGLPDVNGIEVCRQIRAKHDVPVIFLTARGAEVDRVVGLELGADDYIAKPFSPRELSARVKAVLRRTSRSSGAPAASKAFHVDEDRCAVSYFGKPLDLSRYEYRLLCVFIKHPGRVYSRQQLMDAAWESPEASMDRTVDAHIKNIRAKLRAVRGDLDPIATHRGMGYSLKEGL